MSGLHPIAIPFGGQKLFEQTLAADAAAIDSGTFSAALSDLFVLLYVRTTEAVVNSSVLITFNNDTGANYDRQTMRVTNTTVAGAIANAANNVAMGANGASMAASTFASIGIWIPNYSGTVGQKECIATIAELDSTAANCRTEVISGRWRNTAAISRIAATAGSGNLLTGSRMAIYGL